MYLKASTWNCTVKCIVQMLTFKNVECYDVFIICRPSGERGSRNTRSRHLRSSYCCSVYPAVRNSYRALLRSSSIREPSDPPLRVIKRVYFSHMNYISMSMFCNRQTTSLGRYCFLGSTLTACTCRGDSTSIL